jgi:hypothetical protein
LRVTGATKNETKEMTVVFKTEGTQDVYEKLVVAKIELISIDTEIVVVKPI